MEATQNYLVYSSGYFHNARFIGNVFAGPLFAVSVTKYSIKKLKWPGIISYIIVSCVINLAVSLFVPFIVGSETGSRNGFCTIKQSLSGIIFFSSGVLFVALNIVIVTLFSIGSFCFVKSNEVLMEDAECPSSIKKAIKKVLAFYVIIGICLLIQLVLRIDCCAYSSVIVSLFDNDSGLSEEND